MGKFDVLFKETESNTLAALFVAVWGVLVLSPLVLLVVR